MKSSSSSRRDLSPRRLVSGCVLESLRLGRVDCVFFHSEIVIAPPALYLEYVKSKLPANVLVAAQNCYKEASGAFTGEIR